MQKEQEMEHKKIGFIGQGFIGRAYANDFERRGFSVVRYSNESPYSENKEQIASCDIVFIAVPTPTTPNGFSSDILFDVVSLVGSGHTAVIKSTMLPGTTKKLQARYPDVFVFHSPEFLRAATAEEDAAHPDRNIIGISDPKNDVQIEKAQQVLSVLPKAPYELITSAETAEFVKYAGNTYLTMKMVYVNVLYDLAQKLGLEWDLVKDALGADPRIGTSHLQPVQQGTRGAGGYCFVKDFAAFDEMYEQLNPEDAIGKELLDLIAAKNIDLLRTTHKDVDIVKGVYGELVGDSIEIVKKHRSRS